jgi:hypothetical protein
MTTTSMQPGVLDDIRAQRQFRFRGIGSYRVPGRARQPSDVAGGQRLSKTMVWEF